MTSLPPNSDELVSAYLDGEAAPDEIAIVEANDELMARVESLRALTGRLGATVPVPEAIRETHIAAALGAFDELMGSGHGEAPTLTSVATPAPATPEPTPGHAARPAVSDLSAARERRRSRRSTGLIAAAAAALLLFVGIAVLSTGRSEQSDLATSASDASSETSAADVASSSDDSADSAGDDAAMDEEEAMEEEEAMAEAALAPEPTSAASSALSGLDQDTEPDVDEAMDEEEAMDEAVEAESEDATAGAAEDLSESEPPASAEPLARFFFGDFTEPSELQQKVEALSLGELNERLRENRGAGLFPDCQAEIPELAGDIASLVGSATVGGQSVEIHRVPDAEVETVFIVEPVNCSVLTAFQLEAPS